MTIPKKVPKALIKDLAALQAHEVHELYDREEARRDLAISLDLNASLSVVGQQYNYYSGLYTDAETQYAIYAELVDYAIAQVDNHARAELAKTGEKVTEKIVNNRVAASPIIREVNRLARDAKAQVMYLKGTCDAFKQRKDALIALSYNMREQMKGDPIIREGMGRKNSLSHLSNADFGIEDSE